MKMQGWNCATFVLCGFFFFNHEAHKVVFTKHAKKNGTRITRIERSLYGLTFANFVLAFVFFVFFSFFNHEAHKVVFTKHAKKNGTRITQIQRSLHGLF